MKRSRASPSPTPSLSPPPSPSHKLVRHSPGPPDRALTCSLPPTCSSSPVQFDTLEALESHHSKCHAWICGSQGCGKVFPDGRLMELHQIENHDPVASVKQSQGQPIFQCFLAPSTCGRTYENPKKRRNHMIKRHHFPKEYFFAVVNHGISELIKKHGPGASLLRSNWKPRDPGAMSPSGRVEPLNEMNSMKELKGKKEESGLPLPRPPLPLSTRIFSTSSSPASPALSSSGTPLQQDVILQSSLPPAIEDVDMDDLSTLMASSSLGLVPKQVRKKGKGGMKLDVAEWR